MNKFQLNAVHAIFKDIDCRLSIIEKKIADLDGDE